MARPERNSVDYFPHYCVHGKSMFYIRQKHGNDGYAVWFMLLENLGRADFHYLDLSNKVQILFLSSELGVSEEKLIDIVEDLVTIGSFDVEFWNKKRVVYSEKFVESVKDAYRKRGNECISKNDLFQSLPDNSAVNVHSSAVNQVKVSANPQSIVKDNRVKKTKEDILSIIDSLESDFPYLLEPEFKSLFIMHCKVKKVTTTEFAIKLRLKEISQFDLPWAIKRIEKAIASGWLGLVFDNDIQKTKNERPEVALL